MWQAVLFAALALPAASAVHLRSNLAADPIAPLPEGSAVQSLTVEEGKKQDKQWPWFPPPVQPFNAAPAYPGWPAPPAPKKPEVKGPPPPKMDALPKALNAGTDCACMHWQTVYEKNLATCGSGRELLYKEVGDNLKGADIRKKDEDSCQGVSFYKRQDHSMCVKEGGGVPLFHQNWCYVSKSCQKLNGGEELSKSKVNWKYCNSADGDVLMSELPPATVLKLAAHQDMGATAMVETVYPVAPNLFEFSKLSKQFKHDHSHKPSHKCQHELDGMAKRAREKLQHLTKDVDSLLEESFNRGQYTVFFSDVIYKDVFVASSGKAPLWHVHNIVWPPKDFEVTSSAGQRWIEKCQTMDCRDKKIPGWQAGNMLKQKEAFVHPHEVEDGIPAEEEVHSLITSEDEWRLVSRSADQWTIEPPKQ